MEPEPKVDRAEKSGARNRPKGGDPALGSSLQRLVTLQALTIVILLINSVLLFAIWSTSSSQPAVLAVVSEERIVLDIEQVVGENVTYGVYVDLKNTGGEVARVSATGEVRVSLYGSAFGEEVQAVLNYVSASIAPGESQRLAFGNFVTAPGWHYVVQVRIGWNGGTLDLSRILT